MTQNLFILFARALIHFVFTFYIDLHLIFAKLLNHLSIPIFE